MKSHPEWFAEFDNVEDAFRKATEIGGAVHAWVKGQAYKIYPGGRCERRPWEDKHIMEMRRTLGPYAGEVFGYRCGRCGGFWKTYQQPAHEANCSLRAEGEK